MTTAAILKRANCLRVGVGRSVRSMFDRTFGLVERIRTPLPAARPYDRAETRLFRPLLLQSVMGLVGSLAITWGASQPTSPFTLNELTLGRRPLPAGTSTWYFGTGAHGHESIFVGVVAVYGGMLLLISAWLRLIRLVRLHPGIPVARFVPVFVVWVLPLLVVAPLFSHDSYSYVAQGEQITRHINPYQYGPQVLGVGGNAWASLVDPIWNNVTSPYGPVFLLIAGGIVSVVHHDYLLALVGFRLLALAGTVLIAVFLPRLARSYGLDGAKAFVLVILNPLVLLHFVAGSHNDALMMGLLVAGLALARERHPVLGVVLCSLGALVKVPAIVGVVYIGWDWLGDDLAWRRRVRPVITAGLICLATMAVITEISGLGWGWATGLGNPDTVRSWMDPATAVGLAAGKLVVAAGFGDHTHVLLTVARLTGFLVAAAIGVRLLFRTREVGSLRALGLTLLAVVLLGPVTQPWYLAWGIILLAPVAEGRTRTAIVSLSIVSSYLGLPGGRVLLHQIFVTDPLVIALAVLVLAGVAAVPLAPRLRQLVREHRLRTRGELLAGPADHRGGEPPEPAVPLPLP